MEHHFTLSGTALTVHLPAELDHCSSQQLRQEIDRLIRVRNIRSILFDFGVLCAAFFADKFQDPPALRIIRSGHIAQYCANGSFFLRCEIPVCLTDFREQRDSVVVTKQL